MIDSIFSARAAKPIRVLLLGATGFVGSHVLDALIQLTEFPPRVLIQPGSKIRSDPKIHVVSGNIMDRSSLLRAMEDVDCVINAVSYLGSDPSLSRGINSVGARNVLQACAEHRVDRVVHISTTAVYGSGPHLGPTPGELHYAPESLASITRAEGDRIMIEGGACCIRPNLILGERDRWVMPSLRRIAFILQGLIEGGRALISTIEAQDLGVLIAAVATHSEPIRGALHASDREPVSAAELFSQACLPAHYDLLTRQVSILEAINRLKLHGFTEHQVRMIGESHWYDSAAIWAYAKPLIAAATDTKNQKN